MSDTGSNLKQSASMPQLGSFDELVVEILTRFPAKEAAACKSVSKHWLKLISEPDFPIRHLNMAKRKPKYIIYPYPEQYDIFIYMSLMEENGYVSREIPIYGYEHVSAPQINCFMNGLICTAYADPEEQDDDTEDLIVRIFNPITKNSRDLPKGSPSLVIPAVGVAFEPKTNDFKAFRFFSDSQGSVKYKCKVYESCSTTWRRVSEEVDYPRPYPSCEHFPYYVSVDGAMYWFLWPNNTTGIPVGILSVDVKEVFREINLPRALSKWSFLIEFEGCLGLVLVDHPIPSVTGHCTPSKRYKWSYLQSVNSRYPKSLLEVYKLENHQWCLRAHSEMDPMDIHCFNSIAARNNEIFFIIKHDTTDYYSYLIFDLAGKTWTTLNLRNEFIGSSPVAYPFVESLLKCGEDVVVHHSDEDDDSDDDDDNDNSAGDGDGDDVDCRSDGDDSNSDGVDDDEWQT